MSKIKTTPRTRKPAKPERQPKFPGWDGPKMRYDLADGPLLVMVGHRQFRLAVSDLEGRAVLVVDPGVHG